MAAIYHAEIPVDLAGASRERPLPVQFFRGDNDSHIFTAWVGDSANPEAGLLAGTVAGTALRGDGVTVTLSGEKGSATVPVTFNGITVQATPCRVTLPQAAFRIPGMIKVSIVLTDGETTTTVLSLSGSVAQTNTDAVTDPEELIPNLSALQTAAAQAIAAAEDAETAAESVPALVAPTFNTTTAYAAGDYVYYNGSIWRFTAAHAAGAWTGSDAVQTTVTGEFSDLKSAFADDLSEYLSFKPFLKKNVYIETQNGNESAYSGWSATDFISCHGEKLLLINTVEATAYNIFYNSSKAKIKGFTLAVGDNTVDVPNDAYYYRISNETAAMESMTIKTALYIRSMEEAERSQAYDRMGNALLSGIGKASVRTIYVPYTFASGQKYHITIKNSTASISEMRIVSAPNLNQDSIIYSYPVGGGYAVEMDYSCDVSNALYVAIIAVSGTTGFNADYTIFADYNPYNYIGRVKENVDCVIGNYPAYYDAYMQTKQNTIKSVSPLHGIQFAFITDLHFPYNAGNSLELLQAIRKNTAVNLVICGGDFVRAYGGQDDIDMARDRVLDYAKTLYSDWACLRGNHDFTIRTSAQDTSGITETDDYTYGAIIAPMAEWRYDVPAPTVNFYNETQHIGANYCWVLTNEKQKIKIIGFCDMPVTNTTKSFGVVNTITNAYARYFAQLLEDTNGYNVIVATHAPMTAQLQGGYDNHLTTIIEAFANKTVATWGNYNVDFSNNTAILVCCISGHNHTDQSLVVNNVLHINSTCDASYNDDGYNRQVGTVTEQAFDVFTVNFSTRHIYGTRIGAGTDRSWSY